MATGRSEDKASSKRKANQRTWSENLSNTVDKTISKVFRKWSELISARPYTVISFTTIFALMWGAAFFIVFKQELNMDDLWTPTGAQSFDDRDYVESIYGAYTGRGRILSIRNRDIENSNDCPSKLLLKDSDTARESIQAFFKVYEAIKDAVVYYKGNPVTFDDICLKSSEASPCKLTSILDLWEYDAETINAPNFDPLPKINNKSEALVDQFGLELSIKQYLGKNTDNPCEEETDRSSNVEALAMTLFYIYEREEIDGSEIDPEVLEWVDYIVDYVRDISKGTLLDSYSADEIAVYKRSNEMVQKDIRLLSIGYFLIVFYVHVILYKNNWGSCKIHLSFASIIGIALAIASAFGMAQVFGIKSNLIVQILPFLLLGLGVDDTFVIMGAYHGVDRGLSVDEKIAQTLERAGSSIFITSATDFCAFIMGRYTRLPAVQAFATYAAMGVLFDFIYQVSFFIAFLVLEARREIRYMNGAPFLGVQCGCSKNAFDDIAIKAPKCQEMETMHSLPSSTDGETHEESQSVPDRYEKKICGSGKYDPKTPNFATKIAGTYIPAVTLHPIGRWVVLLLECGILAWAIYGCTHVTMNSLLEWLTPKGSSLDTAFDLEKEYFYGNQLLFSVYTKEAASGDYFYHQDQLKALKIALDKDSFVVPPVRTWYEGFSEWLVSTSNYTDQLLKNGSAPDSICFHRWLNEYLDTDGQIYKSSVLFDDQNLRILSSKIDVVSIDIVNGDQSVALVDSVRNSVETAAPSFDPCAFTIVFLFFDGFKVITWETLRNVIMAGVGVFVMTVIVLSNIPTAIIVVIMVAFTDIVVVGYMYYVDEYFNPITAINLVLIVGIAVDYSAHIAHSFLMLDGDRLSRAKSALEHIGGEVLSGAFTTWLGIVCMVFAQHYFFKSFFKMFFAIIVIGAWNGLILLPVILSFIGAKPYLNRIENSV